MGVNGSDILLLVNTGTAEVPVYEAVGSQRDVTIEETPEVIDFSAKAGRAKRVGAGRYGSTLSLDVLYVPTNDAYLALKAAKRAGELILVAVQDDGVVEETANALITNMSRSFPDQGDATISIGLEVDGEWTEVGT